MPKCVNRNPSTLTFLFCITRAHQTVKARGEEKEVVKNQAFF